MANGKKKRSLREAFGVVRPSEEQGAVEPSLGGGTAAGPVSAPEGGKPAAGGEEKAENKPTPRRKSRAGSNGESSGGGARTGRRTASKVATNDPASAGNGSGTRSGGRGRAAAGSGGGEPAEEMVPGKGGKMIPAETPVNMTFTVTAKERYEWTLELKRRGLTAVGVLRETMEAMVEENRQ